MAIQPDGPSARAGLRVGDIVQEIEGVAIEQDWHIRREVGQALKAHTGANPLTLRLRVWRDGATFEAAVTVAAPSADATLGATFER